MKSLNIKSKLLLLSLVPMTIIAIFSYMILDKILKEKDNLEFSKKHIVEAGAIAKIIHFMQIERGLSVGYAAGLKKNESLLLLSKKNVDSAIKNAELIFFHKGDNYKIIKNIANKLKTKREQIYILNLSSTDVKEFYTKEINSLIDIIKILPSVIEDKDNRNLIQSYSYLTLAKEALGQIRAILNEVFIVDSYMNNDFFLFVENVGVYNANMLNFMTIAPKEVLNFYRTGFTTKEINETFEIIDFVIKHEARKNFNVEASAWFEKSTKSIDFLHQIDLKLFNIVNESISQKLSAITYKIAIVILFLIFTIIMIATLIIFMMKKILFSTNLLEKEYLNSLFLLKQYKSAMDESAIVSKTDKNGILTYVNCEFCKVSGYEEYELIGRPHDIIKHPNMQKEVLEDMWYTIKYLKKPWKGEIKNRKKDGSTYWVKAYIKPILDDNDEIIEHIGIRTDITKIIEQKSLFEKVAKTDVLTNYGNRYKLNHDIKEKENLSLALFNIDDFRQINDFYGHKFGDNIIKSAADKIYNFILRDNNLFFYRLQGDEFALLATEYEKEDFILKCKDILFILKNTFAISGKEIVLSCSCGISFEEKRNLLISTDMPLKTAKQKTSDFIEYDKESSLKNEYENIIKCAKKQTTA